MGDVIDYIFSNMKATDRKMGYVFRTIANQNAFNKAVVIFSFAATANIYLLEKQRVAQAHKIKKLEQEIEELKHPERE